MRVAGSLAKLVVGMGRLGEHLLKQKAGGIIVASLAFACGAGLAHAPKGEPRPSCAAVQVESADPARAEVGMRDTQADEAEELDPLFEGVYANYAYGYSVRVPDGMI